METEDNNGHYQLRQHFRHGGKCGRDLGKLSPEQNIRSITYNIRRMASEKFDTKISEETSEELYQKYLLEDITGLIKYNQRIGINIGSKLQAEMLGL